MTTNSLKTFCLIFFFNSIALQAEERVDKEPDYADIHKIQWQGWSLCFEAGSHFKTLLDVDFSKITTKWGHDSRYWGEFGVLFGLGFKYARTFATSWYWDIKTMWTVFYPDIRWHGEKSQITLSSIPLIGKYISLGSVPGYLTMLIPILYFDIGYITKQGYVFSLGSAYLWGLAPALQIPFNNNWSLEFRSTIFLDRLLFDQGYHNAFFGLGVNYKF